jgi:predicted PurR-regulated permease PerM
VFSLFFAYLIFPIVRVVERRLPRRGRRPLAIGVVYLLLLLALVGVGLGVGPRLSQEFALLTEKAPQMSEQIASGEIITNILQRRGWDAERVRQVEDGLRDHADRSSATCRRARRRAQVAGGGPSSCSCPFSRSSS